MPASGTVTPPAAEAPSTPVQSVQRGTAAPSAAEPETSSPAASADPDGSVDLGSEDEPDPDQIDVVESSDEGGSESDGLADATPKKHSTHVHTLPEEQFICKGVRFYIKTKRKTPTGKYYNALLRIGKAKARLSEHFGYYQLGRIGKLAAQACMLKKYTKSREKEASCIR